MASHLFQLVHFGSFWVPGSRGRFEALNNVFRARHSRKWPLNDSRKMCSPRIDLSNGLSCAYNGDRTQELRPREDDVLTYPNGAHMTFGVSSPRVRFFGCLRFLTFLIIVKWSSEPHCNDLLANERDRHISSHR